MTVFLSWNAQVENWSGAPSCNCSEANVNFHMGNIRRKFGVTSRRVAAIMAVNLGLITL
ncbi:LuxR C-terminal-related transcriptional regulator [Pseudomonas aeruginosa]|uniref:LuxR C-terminal-related transcriptional regulator n=1 Tax=Pseudomonas aeruginosa TaxID=287 RepID=UPI0022369086|nr:LuxR C-terminal-related transcriptional regulator [Pseudomonas aeruginosa]